MTVAEVDAFLKQRKIVVVVADDPAGPAPVAAIAVANYADQVVEVELPSDDPVAVALAGGSRICCIAEQSPSYYEIKAVIVRGAAEPRATADPARRRFGVAIGSPTSFDFGRLPEAAGDGVGGTDGMAGVER